jgi:hypothetical protein
VVCAIRSKAGAPRTDPPLASSQDGVAIGTAVSGEVEVRFFEDGSAELSAEYSGVAVELEIAAEGVPAPLDVPCEEARSDLGPSAALPTARELLAEGVRLPDGGRVGAIP